MAWNGSGAFSRTNGSNTGTTVWQQDEAGDVDIEADRHDTHDQDLATGINACLAKNGENAMTGNLNMGSQNITNAGDGTFSGTVTATTISGAMTSLSVTGSTATDLSDNGNPVNIGTLAGTHLALDVNGVQAKSNATTATTLELNNLGGAVNIGPQAGTGAVTLYHSANEALRTTSAGLQIDGDGSNITFTLADGGTSYGFLTHDITTALYLRSVEHGVPVIVQGEDSGGVLTTLIAADPDGSADLYYDGTKVAGTSSSGMDVFGTTLDVDNSSAATAATIVIRNSEGGVRLYTDGGESRIRQVDADGSSNPEDWVLMARNGAVTLNYDNSARLATSSAGATVTGTLNATTDLTVDGESVLVVGDEINATQVATTRSTSTTLVARQMHAITSGATVNSGTAGEWIAIYNNSASAITLTQGSGVTLRLAGTTTTGNRTLAARGMAVVYFNTATDVIASGNGVS